MILIVDGNSEIGAHVKTKSSRIEPGLCLLCGHNFPAVCSDSKCLVRRIRPIERRGAKKNRSTRTLPYVACYYQRYLGKMGRDQDCLRHSGKTGYFGTYMDIQNSFSHTYM